MANKCTTESILILIYHPYGGELIFNFWKGILIISVLNKPKLFMSLMIVLPFSAEGQLVFPGGEKLKFKPNAFTRKTFC